MVYKVKNPFFVRHTESPPLADGIPGSEEDFYITHSPPRTPRNILYCFAYGDCLWRKGDQQYISGRGYTWWAFNYIAEGNGLVICDRVRYRLAPGDVYISRPGREMTIRPGAAGFFRKKTVLLRGQLVDPICQSARLDGIAVIRAAGSPRLEKIYKSIKDHILSRRAFLWEDLGVQVYALLTELARLAAPLQYPPALHRAMTLVDGSLEADYTLQSLSRECKVSVSTLSRLFRKHLKISPINYIINRRLQQAEMLIQLGRITLKEVAGKCGYKSEPFFSRSFKKKYGVSPAAFRAGRRAEKA